MDAPAYFSSHFNIDPAVFAQIGCVDPILNYDNSYFIDITLLESCESEIIRKKGTVQLQHFFQVLFDLLSLSGSNKMAWNSAIKLLSKTELRALNLGYGLSSVSGQNMGDIKVERFLVACREIIDAGVSNPALFSVMPLIQPGIGPDTLSDIASTAMAPALSEYTQDAILQIEGIKTAEFSIQGEKYNLPPHPFKAGEPILLVPADIVMDLPVSVDWDSLGEAMQYSAEIKERFGYLFTEFFSEINRAKSKAAEVKKAAKKAIHENPLLGDELIEFVKAISSVSAKFRQTPDGESLAEILREELFLLNAGSEYTYTTPKSSEELMAFVNKLIEEFKFLIEYKGSNKLLHNDLGKPRKEKFAQQLFYHSAFPVCQRHSIELDPEHETGVGPVDFKLSAGGNNKVIVEIKMSNNTRLAHGYESQVPLYQKASKTNQAFFVCIDVGSIGGKWKKVVDLKRRNDRLPQPVLIDAKWKPSASKR
ncbi:MAG: hypothetical protein KF836_12515 [Fimbriimonadaceae bacterium]|nr:hypothetical protein [Fimbriimonadaceae bacterium]